MKKVKTNKQKPSVVISPNLKRTRERVDANGNTIDPRTKEIIKKKQ